jgi:hypothetical protein
MQFVTFCYDSLSKYNAKADNYNTTVRVNFQFWKYTNTQTIAEACFVKEEKLGPEVMAHVCNPIYLGGGD